MTDVPATAAHAYPPETVEGWYALHQIFRILPEHRERLHEVAAKSQLFQPNDTPAEQGGTREGWSGAVRLIGSTADLMFVHFRPTLDDLGMAQRGVEREGWLELLHPVYSFLSITEAGLYHATSTLAQAAAERGGKFGDDEYRVAMQKVVEDERNSAHVLRRLYPPRPTNMPYVCFYPMSKRRDAGQNWYTLALAERSLLMRDHGMTGRRYAGRVQQVITGAIGLDAWEWGVTLFSADPLEFKKLVTDMRFDEVSARYAEFGTFYVGRMGTAREVVG